MDKKKRLVETSWWEGLAGGESGSCSDRWAMLSKSLIQFSVKGGAMSPLCSLASGQTMVGVMVVVVTSFKRTCASMPRGSQDCCSQYPCPHSRPLLTHASARGSWTLTGKSGLSLVGSQLISPGAPMVLLVPSKSLFPQSYGNSVIKSRWPSKSNSLESLSPSVDPQVGNLLWALDVCNSVRTSLISLFSSFVGCLLGCSMVGLIATFSKRIYAIWHRSQVCCSQSRCPCSRPCWSVHPQETLKHSKAGLA